MITEVLKLEGPGMNLDGIPFMLRANNKKIGPILAIKTKILIINMLLKKLI